MYRDSILTQSQDMESVALVPEKGSDQGAAVVQHTMMGCAVREDDELGIPGHAQQVLVVVGTNRIRGLQQASLVGASVGKSIADE
jgi:hypothetical protein